jgi:pyridoxal 5'-phosphate synthase pdxS subunit
MDTKKVNGSGNGTAANEWRVKVGLAEMLKGGVIMDVTNAEQAKIAEKAGACAVMALERVPSDIRKEGGDDSGDGEGAHRALCRGGSFAGARSGLY